MLTWRIGVFVFAALLVFVGGLGLWDNRTNRITIAALEKGNERLAGWLGDANRNLGACESSVTNLTAGLDRARGDIAKLGTDTEARDRALLESMGRAAQSAAQGLSTAKAILARPTANQPGTLASCAAGEGYLRGSR